MTIYRDTADGRQVVAVEVKRDGRRVGWVEPADWHAFLRGDIDADGLCHIAALRPDRPTGEVEPPPSHVELLEP